MRSRWVSRLVMCTTARENFLNTSIVAASSAPSLSSGRCATGRGSSDTDGCCGRRVWMTGNTSAPATISSSTASTLVMPDSPRYCGGYGSRLTGYSDCDMSPARVYREVARSYSEAPLRNVSVMRREEVLGVERGHAAAAGGRDRLTVLLVLDIPGRKHSRHGRCRA